MDVTAGMRMTGQDRELGWVQGLALGMHCSGWGWGGRLGGELGASS